MIAQKGYVDFPRAWFSDDATHMMMSRNGCCTTADVTFSYRQSPFSISGKRENIGECLAKVKASYEFYEWARIFYKKIDIKKELVYRNQKFMKEKVIRNVNYYIYGLPLSLFLWYLYLCPGSLKQSRLRMLLHWFRIKK